MRTAIVCWRFEQNIRHGRPLPDAQKACHGGRCGRIGCILHAHPPRGHMETLPPRKVFCGKQLFKQNPCSWVRAERVGTPGTGIQDAGNGDSGVLESEIYESRIQGAGTRDSVGTMVSWPHGTREVLVRQLGGLVVTRASRLRGTRIQGCRNQKLRATWDQDSRMPKTGTLEP